MFASLLSDSSISTHSGATKNATNSAASGRTSGDSSLFKDSRSLLWPACSPHGAPAECGVGRPDGAGRPGFRFAPSGLRPSHLDLAVEPVDQRATLRIDLAPIEAAHLGKLLVRLGNRRGERALERDLRVGRD